jgi:hypothetical protein
LPKELHPTIRYEIVKDLLRSRMIEKTFQDIGLWQMRRGKGITTGMMTAKRCSG